MDKKYRLALPDFPPSYWIIVAAFCCLFIYGGVSFYSFSLFVKPLQADFGWGRGQILLAATLFYVVAGAASPYLGRIIDRYGVRRVVVIGAVAAGFGFALLSLTSNLWYFYGIYIVVALGIASVGPVAATAVISRWFQKGRGTALGIMSTGIGAGGLVFAPVIGNYIIPQFGWRIAYLFIALLTWLLIIPLAVLVLGKKPSIGPTDTLASGPNLAQSSRSQTDGLKAAMSAPALWLIGLSFLTCSFAGNGIVQNQVPYLQDAGFPLVLTSAALGLVGLGSIFGKLLFGWLCDRIPPKFAWCISIGLGMLGLLILLNIKTTWHPAVLWIYAIVIGIGLGGYLPMMSMLVSSNFGSLSYGAIFGMVALFQSMGTAFGPVTAGYMYDALQSYRLAFIIFMGILALAIILILLLRRPRS